MPNYDHPNDQMPGGSVPEPATPGPLDAQLLVAARAVERWWLNGGSAAVGGTPACIFQLRQVLQAWADVQTPNELAVLYAEPEFWRPIKYAPVGRPVLVGWLDPEDKDNPERHQFDVLEDGVWQVHHDDHEHFLMVAPPGSRGPTEHAPYTHFVDLPPLPAVAGAVVDAEHREVGELAARLSSRVVIDDARDVAVVNGTPITGALLDAMTLPTAEGQWFRAVRSQDGQMTIERRTDDQLHQLTSALEVQRALKIADDVSGLGIGGKDAAAPTPFQTGFQTACEEIVERLRTEVHMLPEGIVLPACGTLPSLRQLADGGGRVLYAESQPTPNAPQDAPAEPVDGWRNALDIRTAQGWVLTGTAVPVLYTDSINGRQVMRDDVWLATTDALKGEAKPMQAPAQDAAATVPACPGTCCDCGRGCAAAPQAAPTAAQPAAGPTTHDLIVELREALGLFAGSMPRSPKEVWEEAIGRVKEMFATTPQVPEYGTDGPQSPERFKAFHRSLCARFGYTHDEVYWWRELVSLEEYIACKLALQAPALVPLTLGQTSDLTGSNVNPPAPATRPPVPPIPPGATTRAAASQRLTREQIINMINPRFLDTPRAFLDDLKVVTLNEVVRVVREFARVDQSARLEAWTEAALQSGAWFIDAFGMPRNVRDGAAAQPVAQVTSPVPQADAVVQAKPDNSKSPRGNAP